MTTGTATAGNRSPAQNRLAGDFAYAVEILRRRWSLVAAAPVVCLTLAVVYIAATDRMYQATSRLLVLQQGSRPLSVAGGDSGRLVEGGGADDFLPTHAVVIRSPMVVSRAVETVGLANLPTLRRAQQRGKDVVATAIELLTVSRPDRSAKVLRIDFQAGSREEAVRMVRAVTDGYRTFLDEHYRTNSNQVIALISKARAELAVDLKAAEEQYVKFRQGNLAHSTDEAGHTFLTRRLDHWDRASNEAMVREVQLRSQLELGKRLAESGTGLWAVAYALSQFGGESASGLVSYAASVTQSTASDFVRQLSGEQQQLAEKYGPGYTKVKELNEQIQRIQERNRDSKNRLDVVETRDLLRSIELSVQSVDSLRKEYGRRFADDLKSAEKAEENLLTETRLRDNLERQRSLFNTVVDQLKQAQFTSDFTSISSQVIEPANATPSPVRPRVALTLLLAAVAGGVLGAGSAAAADRLDSRLRSSEEVGKVLGYRMLGRIPLLPKQPGDAPRMAGLVSHALPRSPSAEAYRMVRTNLEFLRRDRRVQVIMVTSPHPGDGKSVTASNLAITLAHVGRKVLLVDADMRKPTQDWVHDAPRSPGLVHVLRDLLPIHRVVQRSAVENLDLITAGPETAGPAELLTSDRMGEFLEAARQSYDVIVVDSPPLLAVTDASIIGSMADGVVLVVRMASIRQRDAERVVELLANLSTPVLGTVVNRISVERNGYTYGYGAGPAEPDAAGDPETPAGAANGRYHAPPAGDGFDDFV